MDKANFPVEFNNEMDDVKKSENEHYTLAVDRLSKLADGHTDISGAAVNFKQPAKEHQKSYINEVTIVVYMGSDPIAATEKVSSFNPLWMAPWMLLSGRFVNTVNNSETIKLA